jgi:hypothetical protein
MEIITQNPKTPQNFSFSFYFLELDSSLKVVFQMLPVDGQPLMISIQVRQLKGVGSHYHINAIWAQP